MYKWLQLLKNVAKPGKSITPIDQNCSNNVTMIVFGLPAVISETGDTKNVQRFVNISRLCKENWWKLA